MSKSRDTVESIRTALLDADIGTSVLAPDGDGSNLTGLNAVVVGSTLPDPVSSAGSLFYIQSESAFYISNGTIWSLVSNQGPTTTGGTVVIPSAVELSGSYSYDLGLDFEDDVNADSQLVYTLASGSLPTGAVLPTTGNTAFTGTIPIVSSDTLFSFQIRATDVAGASNTQNFQWSIVPAVPATTGGTVAITPVSEGGSASYDVDTDFTFSSGSVFSAYSLFSGTLPTGTSLNTSTGVISGTAPNDSSFAFTIRATDTGGYTADQAYTWLITTLAPTTTGGTVTITAVSGGGAVSYDVNTNFTFTAGSALSAFSLLSGALPSGTTLNTSTGVISGSAPNTNTTHTFVIRSTDSDGDVADQSYLWEMTFSDPLYAYGVYNSRSIIVEGWSLPSGGNVGLITGSILGTEPDNSQPPTGGRYQAIPNSSPYYSNSNGAGILFSQAMYPTRSFIMIVDQVTSPFYLGASGTSGNYAWDPQNLYSHLSPLYSGGSKYMIYYSHARWAIYQNGNLINQHTLGGYYNEDSIIYIGHPNHHLGGAEIYGLELLNTTLTNAELATISVGVA